MRKAISFGPFRLFLTEQLVEKDDVPIRIGGRSLDILICLAERAGEAIGKRDLVVNVSADIRVEGGSLRFHGASLRRALGDVATTPGRGYSPVSAVSRLTVAEGVGVTTTALASRSHRVPQCVAHMIGRGETVEKLIEEFLSRRIVTVVGPGGIGRATVAVAVGHAMLSRLDGAMYFLARGSLSDGRLAPDAIASMLGLLAQHENSLPGLLTLLKDQRMLLVRDSCERIVETTAGLVEEIFEKAPQVHSLATSRESPRADRQYVHRRFPLKCPPEGIAHARALRGRRDGIGARASRIRREYSLPQELWRRDLAAIR